jgi:signal transduction histidine kinase/ABC-type amino acid transport substrate-binding protein
LNPTRHSPRVMLLFLLFTIVHAGAQDRVVKIGVYENPPKVFIDESGNPAGIFIDIIEDIAGKEGWKLHYRRGGWAENLVRLEAGEIDLMPDVAYSAAREEIFDFHEEPVLSDWFQVYAPRGSGVKSIVDLGGKRIVVLERSVQQNAFEQLAGEFGLAITLISLPDYETIFKEVAAGNADAAVTNRFYGQLRAGAYGLEDTAVVFNPTHLFFAAPKGESAVLLEAVDRHLKHMKKDLYSIYYTSLKRWTAEEVKFVIPSWMKVAGLVVGVTFLLSLAGSVVLKRRVDERTGELRKFNQEMELRVKERTEELAEAMERAQAADRLKSVFLASMSHELRTPLNSIIGFTGILLKGLAGPLNDEQEKQLAMVQNSSRHLLALINDVLDISKIEAGQLTLAFSSFSLRHSLEKCVELVFPMAEKKGLRIILDIAEDVDKVMSDPRRLEQVFLNLFTNAIKFTDEGEVNIKCRREHKWYLLSVTDTGIGIKGEDISRLFQPFHQIDAGTTRKYEGTGLGLSICKRLIGMLGGSISVQSTWGQGSTFTLRFPSEAGGAA